MNRTSKIFLVLLLCALPSLRAEGADGFFQKLVYSLNTPSKVFDSLYVYRLDNPWTVSLNGDLIWTGINLHRVNGIVSEDHEGNDFQITSFLDRQFFKKIGAGFSLGSLALGYTAEIDRHGTKRNKYLNFSFLRPRFGVSFQYYTIHEYLDGYVIDTALPDEQFPFRSWEPGLMRNMVIDGFYFFNPEHFSYMATTGRNTIQRRSAGSWVASVCYTQGEFKYNLTDGIVLEFPDNLGKIRTGALAIGGGYSFNWVPYHRAPNGHSTKGFRNLTINATLLPRVTLYNHVHLTKYSYIDEIEAMRRYEKEYGPVKTEEDFENMERIVWQYERDSAQEDETLRSSRFFHPTLNLSARTGFIFSWERFFICATTVFNRYSFRDMEVLQPDPDYGFHYKSTIRGNFFDVTTRVQLNIRF
ncbi:MAG: DUF4421 domain-containing protein [Bacteroidales bacterium]|nr:DUF4421 domain-containing protein [Bacteroidales bacterium]